MSALLSEPDRLVSMAPGSLSIQWRVLDLPLDHVSGGLAGEWDAAAGGVLQGGSGLAGGAGLRLEIEGGLQVEIKQSRNSNRIRYQFGEDELNYSLEDSSGSRSFSVQYTDISRDRQTLEERNQWLRNAGLLWIALGGVLTAMSYFGEGPFRASFWLWIGLGCYAVYWFRRTKFTILPTEKGNLLVIDNDDGPRLIQEIESRRATQFLREYDFMDAGETPQQQHKRFKWLHSEGALSDEEFGKRVAMIGVAVMPSAAGAKNANQLLN